MSKVVRLSAGGGGGGGGGIRDRGEDKAAAGDPGELRLPGSRPRSHNFGLHPQRLARRADTSDLRFLSQLLCPYGEVTSSLHY